MPLLRPRAERRRSKFRTYTTVRCPFNGHQVGWCRGLCMPIGETGTCGRTAGHAMRGRTQTAIANYAAMRRGLEASQPKR